jgi:arsenate reductase
MAEALLRSIAADRFEVASAGSEPAGFVHALAEETMDRMGIPLERARSKSWDEFTDVPLDVVITLCDNAAAQPCPAWRGDPIVVHWSLPDPAYHLGTDAERLAFAMRVAERLRAKIEGLVNVDFAADRDVIDERLRVLGDI